MFTKHKTPGGRSPPLRTTPTNYMGAGDLRLPGLPQPTWTHPPTRSPTPKGGEENGCRYCVPFGVFCLGCQPHTHPRETHTGKNEHHRKARNPLQGQEGGNWEGVPCLWQCFHGVKMERRLERLLLAPHPWLQWPASPPAAPSGSPPVCAPAALREPPCPTSLTCRHSAILGPLAANPETCTWEAKGVLRSPNQPSLLRE